MIEGLKPYAEYKESGLLWLPMIPNGWQTIRNGSLFSQRNETNHPQLPILEVSLRTGVRVRNFETSNRKQLMSDFSKYKRAVSGDITYNMMRMWQGAVGVAPVDGLVSPAYVVARPFPKTNSHYYRAQFKMDLYLGEIDGVSRGIVKDRNRLYWDQFKQMRSLAPPPNEQAAIVRFLDHANRKIDGFIRAKRKLIGLLNEQKQAIIHRAVTRGLDHDVPLKHSGIPWLGEIPMHWESWPLRRCITIRSGDFADPLKLRSEPTRENCVPVVGGNGVMGYLDKPNNTGATIVIGRVGALCGNVHLVEGDTWITDNALRITRIAGFEAGYLAEQLKVMNLNRLANANAQPLVTGAIIKSQRVVKPPSQEQRDIVEKIPTLVAPLNTAIARTEREIALMQEYRTRLTADIVTGKLDVREAAAKLPDLSTDPAGEAITDEALDDAETEDAEA